MMKFSAIAPIAAIATATIASFSGNLPAIARPVQFSCVSINNTPTTIARTSQGNVTVISWRSSHFSNSGFTPEKRCQIVSERFQTHSNKGTLRFITVGKINGQNVMCVAQRQGAGCRRDGLLLTFEPQDDPYTVIKDLFGVSRGAGGSSVSRGESKPYINIGNVLQKDENSGFILNKIELLVTLFQQFYYKR
jgi:hypothetical protein